MTNESKILKQLERNYYYLSVLKRERHHYVFVSSERKFYCYSQDTLQEIQTQDLYQMLKNPQIDQIYPDALFAPVNYLISPFNNTESFIQNEYFLTSCQEEIYKSILDGINTKTQHIFSISGQAGTGKTLLTYHIVKNLVEQQYQVAVVHCANSNDGINKLKQLGWHIYTIKEFDLEEVKADVIVIDESQRISVEQLQKILRERGDRILIFSHDVHQKLNRTNEAEKVTQEIEEVAQKNNYKLSNKIRHNQEIAYFIKKIFNPSNKAFEDSKPKKI
ncbi:ATP-binding protein [Helicobacter labetoulli]|uniref:ATP-binding protein n=1 Tax=Helicobacter labetoulli TaxID=2315333 RepID=UPI000EF73B0F|nr:ATP-binding protein [Helicobacter labetoulli]